MRKPVLALSLVVAFMVGPLAVVGSSLPGSAAAAAAALGGAASVSAIDGEPYPGFVEVHEPLSAIGPGFIPHAVIDDELGHLLVAGSATAGEVLLRYEVDGTRDLTFGQQGRLELGRRAGSGTTPALLPDGRIVISAGPGVVQVIGVDGESVVEVPLRPTLNVAVGAAIAGPDGRVAVLTSLGYTPNGSPVVTMLAPEGVVDPGYRGMMPAGLGGAPTATSGAWLPGGRLVVSVLVTRPGTACLLVAFDSTGELDPNFGAGGVVDLGPSARCAVKAEPSGTILAWGPAATWTRHSAAGQPLPGSFSLPGPSEWTVEGTGRIVIAERAGVSAIRPDGSADPSFHNVSWSTFTGSISASSPQIRALVTGDLALFGTSPGPTPEFMLALLSSPWGVAPRPPTLPMARFVPISPRRLLDTRIGLGAPAAALPQGGQIDVQVAGAQGIPADASAVVMSVAATDSSAPGFITVWPGGTLRPTVASINVEHAGQSVANLVTVKLGPTGTVALFSQRGAHLVADAQGYYVESGPSRAGRFVSVVAPARLFDTREGLSALAAGGQVDVQVAGVQGVPSSGVAAVVLNLAATNTAGPGFFTVWPTGGDRPFVSSLNVTVGETRSNMVIAPLGDDGKVSFFSQSGADLIADVAGWFTDDTVTASFDGLYVPITPTRVLDTRYGGMPQVASQEHLTRVLGGGLVVPPYAAATAVVLNVTATETLAPGYVTLWPSGTPLPLVASLNATSAGQTIPNAAIVTLNAEAIDVFTQAGAHLVLDLFGYYLRS